MCKHTNIGEVEGVADTERRMSDLPWQTTLALWLLKAACHFRSSDEQDRALGPAGAGPTWARGLNSLAKAVGAAKAAGPSSCITDAS